MAICGKSPFRRPCKAGKSTNARDRFSVLGDQEAAREFFVQLLLFLSDGGEVVAGDQDVFVEFPGLLISHGLYFSEIRIDSQGHFRIALINENYNITNFRITYTVRDTDVPVIKYTEERYAEFNSDLIILVPEAIWNWTITITKIEFMVNTKGDYQTVWKGSFNIDKYTKV